jgi:hypothetical protein
LRSYCAKGRVKLSSRYWKARPKDGGDAVDARKTEPMWRERNSLLRLVVPDAAVCPVVLVDRPSTMLNLLESLKGVAGEAIVSKPMKGRDQRELSHLPAGRMRDTNDVDSNTATTLRSGHVHPVSARTAASAERDQQSTSVDNGRNLPVVCVPPTGLAWVLENYATPLAS